MRKKYIYHIGDLIGDLKCIDVIKQPHHATQYKMKCIICGREKNMLGSTIGYNHGIHHSACGQYLKTKNKKFYNTWCGIKTRTNNAHYEHYNAYGERGINSVEFKYFIDFYDSMYDSYLKAAALYGEENLSIERIDNDKNYCKSNCKWIPLNRQKENMRKTVHFVIISNGIENKYSDVLKFCKENGYNDSVIYDLLNGKLKTAYGLRGYRLN